MQNLVNHIFEDTFVGYWLWDASSNLNSCNPTLLNLLAYPEATLNASEVFWYDYLSASDLFAFQNAFEELSQTIEPRNISFKWRLKLPNQEVRYVRAGFRNLLNDFSVEAVVGSFIDITEETLQLLGAQREEKLYQQTSQLGKSGAWEFDLSKNWFYFNHPALKILHQPSARVDWEGLKSIFAQTDDFLSFERNVKALSPSYSTFTLEFEANKSLGTGRWFRIIAELKSATISSTKVFGIIQDITDFKLFDERLNVIFERSTDAHLVFDENGIIDCNAAAVQMLGCDDKATLLRYHPAHFSPDFQPDGITSFEKSKKMDALARQNGYHRFEWLHKRLDGTTFLAEVTLNPIRLNQKDALLVVWHDITERKKAEAKLANTQLLLAETQLLTHSASWVLDLSTHINTYSSAACEIFEIENVSNFPKINPLDWIDESAKAHYQQVLEQAIQTEEEFEIELLINLQNGKKKVIRKIGKPTISESGKVDKIIGAILDITQERKDQEAILIKQEQFASFITNTPAAIAIFDTKLNYIAYSQHWIDSLLIKEQDLVGKNHYEVLPYIPQKWKEINDLCLKGEIHHSESDSFTRTDGKQEWIRWDVRPWYMDAGEIGGIIICIDVITDQIEAQNTLILAKEEAEQAAVAKTQFLSTMSHEIRTPMNAVIGITHLLMQNAREDQAEYLKILKFSAENLLVLINDILDFNKIEAGKITFEEVDFNLKDLLLNIRAALLQKAIDKGIQLKLLMEDDLPEAVKGDSVRIGQILTNLVSNAVKFTDYGRVTISASILKKDADSTTITFEVKDTGIGIPQDKWDSIFDSFTQASSETTRKYGGTGLGLTITKRLLELQGSKIQLESAPGEGSTFYFDLRLKNSSFQFKKRTEPDMTNQKHPSLKGLKLLIADDNRINIIVAQQFFKRWDIESDVAENGVLAVQMVQQSDYDMVLMDLQMPEMDGYEATKSIRALSNDRFAQIPIIALTASAMLDIKDKAFSVGMNDYISKPFNPDDLYRKIALYKKENTQEV
ncbi:PAS domain-containing hybrid sensor histidine kinase/response regulator [Flectobacillus roseus]|uniref:PAS domain-containing hybrid sensor histidine kinase/response regulator n=1 Tax=Flectobacillus roseus TaxID=502259 RepID=UPI0024B85956|nr:PAS domain-containing hybrid sensor histidine kinase/response regulator [Flectobacillus roseus]MDI9868898.1 PAS domain S-box protein [Flectobacillus roseus]